jgi:hypothetical protein
MYNIMPTADSDDVPTAPRPTRLWRYAIASIASLLLIVIAAEITLRLTLGFATPIVYQPDADAGYVAVPSQSVRRFGVSICINAFGMRSDDIRANKPEDTYRIFFLGDSVAYGTARIDQSEIFPSIVRRHIPTVVHQRVEVLNASAGGWAPSNELAFLRSRGTFGSDLVVLVINTLDLNQPFTTLSGDQMSPYSNMPAARPTSAVGELFMRYLLPRIKAGVDTHDPGSLESPIDPATEVPPILRSLMKAKDFSEANGARFAVLFTPQYFLSRRGDWSLATRLFLDWATVGNVTVINMSADFLSVPVSRYYLDNIHPNSAGHALIAQRLVQNWPLITGTEAPAWHDNQQAIRGSMGGRLPSAPCHQ